MRNFGISQELRSTLSTAFIRLLQDIMFDRRVNVGAQQAVTIASNAFTIPVNWSHFSIAASGASTDLKTISGGIDGDVIFCKIANNSNAVVFKHTGGNLICNGAADLTVSSVNSIVLAVYDGVLSKWKCVAFTIG